MSLRRAAESLVPERRSRCPGPASSSSDHLILGAAKVVARPLARSGGSFAGAEFGLQQLRVPEPRGFARLYRHRQFGSAKLTTFESKLPNLQPLSPTHTHGLGFTAPAQLPPTLSTNSCPSKAPAGFPSCPAPPVLPQHRAPRSPALCQPPPRSLTAFLPFLGSRAGAQTLAWKEPAAPGPMPWKELSPR